jgi:gluconokinase
MDVILVLGVSGSGKTTIARKLAAALSGTFVDADDFHPPANIEKMSRGMPLGDEDRIPWLEGLAEELKARKGAPQPLVLACSALKHAYRVVLRKAFPELRMVYLKGDYDLVNARLMARKGHFMKSGMLGSQFADLEEPRDAFIVDAARSPEAILATLLESLRD